MKKGDNMSNNIFQEQGSSFDEEASSFDEQDSSFEEQTSSFEEQASSLEEKTAPVMNIKQLVAMSNYIQQQADLQCSQPEQVAIPAIPTAITAIPTAIPSNNCQNGAPLLQANNIQGLLAITNYIQQQVQGNMKEMVSIANYIQQIAMQAVEQPGPGMSNNTQQQVPMQPNIQKRPDIPNKTQQQVDMDPPMEEQAEVESSNNSQQADPQEQVDKPLNNQVRKMPNKLPDQTNVPDKNLHNYFYHKLELMSEHSGKDLRVGLRIMEEETSQSGRNVFFSMMERKKKKKKKQDTRYQDEPKLTFKEKVAFFFLSLH